MLLIKNLPFTNVVASGVATASLPVGMSYNRIVLQLGGGAFTKSMITDIKVRLNGKVVYQNTGSRLDLINTYRGRASAAGFLVIDFTEPTAKLMGEQFIGNINTAVGVSSLTLEVTISGATTPTLDSWSEVGPPAPLGVIAKQLLFTTSVGGSGKFPFKLIDVANRGAIIKRVHFAHGGNVTALEVKKNGVVIHDNVPTATNSFYQLDYKKVAQTNLYTYDPCVDDNYTNAIKTQDMVSLEFNLTTSAADTITACMEVLDLLGNM
ncbi:major capsid protein P2 [Acidovorax delafieldii]|uniref:major capsid protein P2 n=1 Tax=Acidovorax delafieldii TaxID=47920 RepID=UPI003ECE1AD6